MRERGGNQPHGGRIRAISALAARQHGVVSRRQLLRLGLSSSAIGRLVHGGWLHSLYTGVHLVGHTVPPPFAREMGAVLACGDDALASHVHAGVLWKLVAPPRKSAPITVTTVGRAPRKRGIRAHRVESIHPADCRTLKRIPITSPARTLIDIAPSITETELEQAYAEGLRRHLLRRTQLRGAVERNHHRPGVKAVRRLLGARDPAFTRSTAERLMLALILQAGLPEPLINARLGDREPDFYWPEHRLIVEVDGYDYHSDPTTFESDRRRDAEHLAQGIRTLRTTWRQLTTEPRRIASLIAACLR